MPLRKAMRLVNLTSHLALDERIDELADLVRQHYGLTDLGDPSASTDVSYLRSFSFYSVFIKPSQEEVVVVGRITVDAEASFGSGKLNEASLHLESSRMMGSGVRVPLKFMPNFKVRGGPKGQPNIYLFPGAIVALKGKNGGGGWFSVSEVMTVRLTRRFFPVPMPHTPLVTSSSSLYVIRLAGWSGEARTSRHVVFNDNSLRPLHTPIRSSVQAMVCTVEKFDVTQTRRSPLGWCILPCRNAFC